MESKIQAELMAAMKEKNAEKIAAIREIKTAIMKFKTAPGFSGTCSEADILTLIQKLAKQHKESADMYQAAGREDLVKEELAQLEYINLFLPKMLSEEETIAVLNKAIESLGATSLKDMGKIMNYMKENYPNQYDAKFVGTYVKGKF